MTDILFHESVSTSLGDFQVISSQKGIFRIFLPTEKERFQNWIIDFESIGKINEIKEESKVSKQLKEYTKGERQQFDCQLDLQGTQFQKEVWRTLIKIPYGTTRSYSWVANQIKKPKSIRAVGLANGNNPIPIIIPCHRVIGKNGKLIGYGGGIPLKKKLLELEFANKHFKGD
ncbi:MAG: methylated-DNA--[protein]-cysteine S-methyltransferase [Candidatus Hodarchaeota archaeon]